MPLPFVFGLFGLIIGSFLNVLVLRYGVKSVGGRSECPHCKKTIEWYDNIPVLSWILLRAKCRHCKAHISIQYPLVELLTAVLFALIGAAPHFGILYKLLFCAMAALLVAMAAHDFRTTIIPDPWVYSFGALAFFSSLPLVLLDPDSSLLLFVFAGPIAAAFLFALWFISKGRWMGFGDVKLALGMGWLLGPSSGFLSVFFAFVLGALVSVPLLLLSSERGAKFLSAITPTRASANQQLRFTMKSEIPFGPFLIASCLIVFLMQLYGIPLPLLS